MDSFILERPRKDQQSIDQMDTEARLAQDRILFISDEIDTDSATRFVAYVMYLQSQNLEPITIYINSGGGLCVGGFAMYDIIRACPAHVETIAIGEACSMAALLLAAGDHRAVYPNARVLIHRVSGGFDNGDAEDAVRAAAEHTRMQEQYIALLSRHTGQSVRKLQRDTMKDYYMTASEAVEYGLADEVLEII